MKKTDDAVSLRELLTYIDGAKKEIMSSVTRLENKFDTMEAGRLTRLEGVVSDLKAQQAAEQGQLKTTSFLIPLGISIFFAIANIILFFWKR